MARQSSRCRSSEPRSGAERRQGKANDLRNDAETSWEEMGGELPEWWAEARLEDFVYIAGRIGWRGLKAEEYTESGPLFLSVHSLNKGEYVDFTVAKHISQDRYDESPEIKLREDDIRLAKDGDFLVARGNGSLKLVGRGGLVTEEPDDVACIVEATRTVHDALTRPIAPRRYDQLTHQVWRDKQSCIGRSLPEPTTCGGAWAPVGPQKSGPRR